MIYLDMDGVLVNFLAGAHKATGFLWHTSDWDAVPWHERAKLIKQGIDNIPFWEHLEPLDDYNVLWNYTKSHQPRILTAQPSWNVGCEEPAQRGKRIWCKKHLMIPEDRIHVVYRAQKKDFALNTDGKPNVLVDDHDNNIKEFTEAGGIAILHTSAATTVEKLKELGY